MIEYFETYGLMILEAMATHLFYVIIALFFGTILGLLLGILLSRVPQWSGVLMPILSIFQTIPGIAFIGVLFIYMGIQPATVLIALSIYAMFPILKNTYAGIVSVEPKYVEAAKGCGMSQIQRLYKVELALALPSIIAGVRMSAIYTVSWTVLASMIGLGGLGEFIYTGVSANNNTLIITGAIPAAILAIGIGALIDVSKKRLIPEGIRKEADK